MEALTSLVIRWNNEPKCENLPVNTDIHRHCNFLVHPLYLYLNSPNEYIAHICHYTSYESRHDRIRKYVKKTKEKVTMVTVERMKGIV